MLWSAFWQKTEETSITISNKERTQLTVIMDKVKIAVFGINEKILRVIENEIDPRKAEIVLFIDNDETKQGTEFLNIPVVLFTKNLLVEYAIDFFLVTALSAFELIRKQLIEMGVHKEQIQVFVTEDLCNYCLGSIDDISIDFIKQVYFQPSKMIDMVIKYREIYGNYLRVPAYEDELDEWFNKSSLISHACGGIVNGKRVMYSNSKEAFQYAINEKFDLIECDMLKVSDEEWFLAHEYSHFYESWREGYSMMTMQEFLVLLKEYPNVCCLIDVKWDDYDEYVSCVNAIDRFIESISSDDTRRYLLKNQIIMEVYDEPTIRFAKTKGYKMIYTQYKNPDWQCFMNTVSLCYKYGVKAIALSVHNCLHRGKNLKIFTDKNIKVFAFSTDSIEDYNALRKIGTTGIFTNYLTENNLVGEAGMRVE